MLRRRELPKLEKLELKYSVGINKAGRQFAQVVCAELEDSQHVELILDE